jgi:DNA recombination protein RmuC
MVEQTSNEMLALVGAFNQQWRRYVASTEKVGRHLAGLQAEFDHLMTTRERQLERPLRQLEALRQQRAIPVDPEFAGDLPDESPSAPALRVIDRGSLTADG